MTHHVRHRGNDHRKVFIDEEDCLRYLELLRGACAKYAVDVHNFALMKTHSHVLLTPPLGVSLSNAMREVGRGYSRAFNRKYRRRGTLWHGPYECKEVIDEEQALTCARYIEQNPVRAKVVSRLEDYRWSSYRIHALGEPSEWIVPHPAYIALGKTAEDRQAAFRALCAEPLPSSDILVVRWPRYVTRLN